MSSHHEGPVFLGGVAGTGKTRLGSLLDRHSRLAVTRKTYLWRDVYGRHGDLAEPGNLDRCIAVTLATPGVRALHLDRAQVVRAMAERPPTYAELFDVIHRLHASSLGKSRWCDQLGLVEAYAEPIFDSFPSARFIHMVVDPRCSPSLNRGPGVSGWAIGKWLTSMELAARNSSLFGERYLILRREDLAADEASAVREVCSFLREELEPSMLVPPVASARPPAHHAGADRARFIAATAGATMADSGYDTACPARPRSWRSELVDWPANRLALAVWRRLGTRSIARQIGAGP